MELKKQVGSILPILDQKQTLNKRQIRYQQQLDHNNLNSNSQLRKDSEDSSDNAYIDTLEQFTNDT